MIVVTIHMHVRPEKRKELLQTICALSVEKGVGLRGRVEVGNACDRDVFWLVRSV